MSKYILERSNFLTGEIGDRYLGNSQNEEFENGLTELFNCFVLKSGGVIKRPGTKMAGSILLASDTFDYKIVPYTLFNDITPINNNRIAEAGQTIGIVFSVNKTQVSATRSQVTPKVPYVSASPSAFSTFTGKVLQKDFGSNFKGNKLLVSHIVIPSDGLTPGHVYIPQQFGYDETSSVSGRDNLRGDTLKEVLRKELRFSKIDELRFEQFGDHLYVTAKNLDGYKFKVRSDSSVEGYSQNYYRSPLNMPRMRTSFYQNNQAETFMYVTTTDRLRYVESKNNSGGDVVKGVRKTNPPIPLNRIIVGFTQKVSVPNARRTKFRFRFKDGSTYKFHSLDQGPGEAAGKNVWSVNPNWWVPAEFYIDQTEYTFSASGDNFRELVPNTILGQTRSLFFEPETDDRDEEGKTTRQRVSMLMQSNNGFFTQRRLFNNSFFGGTAFRPNPNLNLFGNIGDKSIAGGVGSQTWWTTGTLTEAQRTGLGRINTSAELFNPNIFKFYFNQANDTNSTVAAAEWVNDRLENDDARRQAHGAGRNIVSIDFGLVTCPGLAQENGDPVITQMHASAILMPVWGVDMWGWQNYPSVAATYQQRFVLGSTPSRPDTLWLSQIGSPERFQDEHFEQDKAEDTTGLDYVGEFNDDDPFNLRGDAGGTVDDLRWISEEENLILGFKNSQKILRGFDDGVIKPGGVKIETLDYSSSKKATPARAGRDVYFISEDGKKLRKFGQTRQGNSFRLVTQDLTLRNEQIVDVLSSTKLNQFKEVVYCDTRNLLICLSNEGDFFTYTILERGGLGAWARHRLGGDPETASVAILPNKVDGWSDAWFVTKRKGAKEGQVFLCFETLGRDQAGDTVGQRTNYIDGSLLFAKNASNTYNLVDPNTLKMGIVSKPFTPLSRLSALNASSAPASLVEGLSSSLSAYTFIASLATLTDLSNYTFAGLTASWFLSGFRIDCRGTLTPLALIVDRDGIATGSNKRIDTLTTRVARSGNPVIGVQSWSSAGDVSKRSYFLKNAKGLNLYTGIEQVRVSTDYSFDHRVLFEMNEPYPFELLAVTIRGVVND